MYRVMQFILPPYFQVLAKILIIQDVDLRPHENCEYLIQDS